MKNRACRIKKINACTGLLILVFLLTLFTGCGKDGENGSDPLIIKVNTENKFQTIAGFGGSNRMWGTQFLKPAEAKKAFGSDDTDLGLSLFRVRISSDSTEWPLILESVKEAQKYGVKILASPWSPPADLKNNNNTIGGYLLSDNYAAFAEYINSFIQYMNSNGVDIYAVSIQNEPDIQVSYESCDWTSTQMINFLKDYGSPIEGAQVAAPESFNFSQTYTNAILNDVDAADNLDIVAGHIYGGGLNSFPLAEQKGKEIWMTEYLLNLHTGNAGAPAWTTYSESEIWNESLEMLRTVHEALTNNWNAYIWWYLQRYYSFIGDGEEGTTNGEILKRGYAFSHFSKYIRPGYVRVDVSSTRATSLDITAFEGDNKIVVVIINQNSFAVSDVNVEIPVSFSTVVYQASMSLNREEIQTDLSDGNVVFDVPPGSITTIVME
jgi:glucuronoarabinoxylan endo-1,4-beta-xylanase